MGAPDETRLLSLAASISNGAHVDWDLVRQQLAGGQDAEVVRAMHLLERIASFHRSTDPSGTPTGDAPRDGETGSAVLESWGHFVLLERVGRGTYGQVYRARDQKLQCEVALKLLDGAANSSHSLKEARLLARVRHPNVVTVHGADLVDGRIGLWMEFVKGRSLANLLRTRGPFGAQEAALIGLDLCRALAAVHGAGLLHGDIKAHNVMREDGGRTVLMDFGTGKDLAQDRLGDRRQPLDDFAGTPLYLAPEVFDGRARTKAADIYGLGVLLYHLVTDRYPVDGQTRADVAQAHLRLEHKHLRDERPDLPEEFVQVVERALAINPRDRHQSAGAFAAALGRFLGAPVADPDPRPRWMLIAASILAIALVGGVAYWVAESRPVPPSSTRASSADLEPAYQIDTAMYRFLGGQEQRLHSGARVTPGDRLFIEVRVSVPAYVYIVNEDEHGESYLLFPLPGQNVNNPLPAGPAIRLPGGPLGQEMYWQVTSPGEREHFLIFASPERLAVLEQAFAFLPHPELGKPIRSARLSSETVSRLRSVGGLTTASKPPSGEARLRLQFPMPLGDTEETARGLWVRQLTLDNPIK